MDDLANRIASIVAAGLKDGAYVNGSRLNCRLSCHLDLLPVKRIVGGMYCGRVVRFFTA